MNKNGRKYGAWLIPITVVLAAFIIFNVICVSGLVGDASETKINASNNRIVRLDSLEGLDELRKNYFNKNTVQSNLEKSVTFDGDRWVIVELNGDTLYDKFVKSAYSDFSTFCKTDEADKYRNTMIDRQNEFLDLLDENEVEYSFKYSYTTLTNGVAVKVKSGAYNVIRKLSEVKDIYFSESYAEPKVAVSNNANVYTTGIYNTQGIDYKGEGMVVAVLDTGLDYEHEAFKAMPENPAWTKEYVAARMAASERFNAKATVDEVYYNSKVPYAYDYADDDSNVYPSYSSHGTHVAGIVAGKSEYVVNNETGETFLGVAPEAQLVICKVFTDNLDSKSLGGADTIDILAAVSDCVELGVDVINMSLGSSCGFGDEKSDTKVNEVYERVKEAGISLVVAASNDYSSGFGGGNGTNLASNPDSATVGSPSTYDAALSVASINGQKASYIQANDDENQVAFITTSSDENGNEYKFTELLYEVAGKPQTETLNFKYVVIGGVGRATNYNSVIRREINNKGDYDGVIALVKRGDTTFAEKVQTAMDYGVDACIIYNNVSGTIRMSLGEVQDPVPTCSISMDAGKIFVENAVRNVGSIQVSMDFKAGPFMSEFSSWGPMPDLQLKPEITAHGGEITSAVPGGYDIYSGTSMAAPNMAGAIALLRQYLKTANPALEGVALNARINQVLMSTATIALNEEGNPYSPRKQGAGLAGIADAINTESYITVLDKEGQERDKTKIELYDDKKRTGVYELEFVINNISGKQETYNPFTYVMTETLASDNKTVAEKAHMLSDSKIEYYVGSVKHEGKLTVPANSKLSVKVVITLGSEGRKYIEDSFENGMYVEGFVSLRATDNTKITIGLPYLAFYGDWNDAPLFDYDTYEIAASEADTGVPEEDKLKASAAATRPLGLYDDDQYIIELGSYLYTMAEGDVEIYPSKEKAAISMYDVEGKRTLYEFYMVYAGLLRNAAYMDAKITDAVTGEVIYEERQENVSKSYANGGSNVGARIMFEIKPQEWGLVNNSTYNVSLKGQLDYPGGENPEKNTFDCQFTIDYEEPQLIDYRVRFDSYKDENKQVKYRIYLDVDVYDNQYVMDVLPCYVKQTKGKNVLTLLTEYPIPVYGDKGEISTVSFEITDIYEEYFLTGNLILAVDDYALNESIAILNPLGGIDYPDGVVLSTDSKLSDSGDTGRNSNGVEYGIYELTLAPNEAYKPAVSVLKDGVSVRSLGYYVSRGSAFVMANEDEIFAKKDGNAVVYLCDNDSSNRVIYAQINVSVSGEAVKLPRLNKITLQPTFSGNNNIVSLDGTLPELEVHPNSIVKLSVKPDPWYLEGTVSYEWASSNKAIADVDAAGNVTTYKKGTAIITASVKDNATVSKSVKIIVSDDYRIVNYTLYDYYGGEECVIPDSKNIMYIDEECFLNNTTIKKIVFPSTLTEIPENAFSGCTNLEEIVIPSQCTVVKKYAFAGCTKLKKITFGHFVDKDKVEHPEYNGAITLGEGAFKDCTSLNEIVNPKRITTVGNSAFENCTALQEIDLTELRVTGKRVFARCTALNTVITNDKTNIGEEMFYGCTALTSFEYKYDKVPASVFSGCTSLTEVTFSTPVSDFGGYAFQNTKLSEVILPDGNYSLGKGAFSGCTALKSVTLSSGTELILGNGTPFDGCTIFGEYKVDAGNQYYSAESGVLYNKDKTVVYAAPTTFAGVTLPSTVKHIARGAFAGLSDSKFSTFDASGVESIGEYAFAGCKYLASVTLPTGITVIPEGLFSGCDSLSEINGLNGVREIGKLAFNGCKAFKIATLPEVVSVGDNAFANSALISISADNLVSVGANAFMGTKLTNVNLPASEIIGSNAFRNITTLKKVTLGPVTEMGEYVFYKSNALTEAVFGEGTKVIGSYAFFAENNSQGNSLRTPLTSVILPDGVENIGEAAFLNCVALTEINLKGTKNIGNSAFFYCLYLASADLSDVINIEGDAFGNTALTEADLLSAESVGEYAFAYTPLTSVNMKKVEKLGAGAFMETKLTTVTLPATFNSRYYDYAWEKYDEKHRVESVKHRNELTYGAGAFTYISTLTEILVEEGNEKFVSMDGVLYSKVENGYVLEQYPTGKRGREYNVIDKTVSIQSSAFEGVERLLEITFPYTVKEIGTFAFYDSSVKKYTFTSVKAPALKSEYINGDSYSDYTTGSLEEFLYVLFGSGQYCADSTVFYANFYDFVAKKMLLAGEYNFGLTVVIPKNGTGYDSVIWKNFFETVVVTDEILPDDVSHEAIDAIKAISEVMTVEEIKNTATLDGLTDISAAVRQARAAYNKITSVEQLNIQEVKDSCEVLLVAEKALRDRKAELGAPVKVSAVGIASIPNKIRYDDGESFDPTGMVIKVIYEDTSEVPVTDYTLDKTVLHYGDDSVTVSYVADGKTYTVKIGINVNEPKTPGGETPGGNEPAKSGLSTGAIVAICVVCGVAGLAGIAVAVLLILKKKGILGKKKDNAGLVGNQNTEEETVSEQPEEKSEQTEVNTEETEE